MAMPRTYVSDEKARRKARTQAFDEAKQSAVRVARAIAGDPSLLVGLSLKIIEIVCSNKDALKIIEPAVVKMAKKYHHTYRVFASALM